MRGNFAMAAASITICHGLSLPAPTSWGHAQEASFNDISHACEFMAWPDPRTTKMFVKPSSSAAYQAYQASGILKATLGSTLTICNRKKPKFLATHKSFPLSIYVIYKKFLLYLPKNLRKML